MRSSLGKDYVFLIFGFPEPSTVPDTWHALSKCLLNNWMMCLDKRKVSCCSGSCLESSMSGQKWLSNIQLVFLLKYGEKGEGTNGTRQMILIIECSSLSLLVVQPQEHHDDGCMCKTSHILITQDTLPDSPQGLARCLPNQFPLLLAHTDYISQPPWHLCEAKWPGLANRIWANYTVCHLQEEEAKSMCGFSGLLFVFLAASQM